MTGRPTGTETAFEGFVTGGPATTVPSQFFIDVMPLIDGEAELRVTLYALYAIGRLRGPLRAVRGSELGAEAPLLRALAPWGGAEALAPALEHAVARGTLLACPLEDGDALYFVNSEGGRRGLLRVQSGALAVPGAGPLPPAAAVAAASSDQAARPARVYEQEIGTLTPAVSEALTVAGERYPEQWIVEALREAARSNARSWRYAEGILRRWEAEGRDDAKTGADSGGAARRSLGRSYEHVVRRE